MKEINIYCDETCHLQKNNGDIMAWGAVWVPKDKVQDIFQKIRAIKEKYGFKLKSDVPNKHGFEIKWNKVSLGRMDFYIDLVNYFFEEKDLHFRGLIVTNKSKLDHQAFNQDHDTFYYKMYFDLLKVILSPSCEYNIYLDIKDTKSEKKVLKLQEVLCNNHYDFEKKIIKKVQQVHSHEVEILQLSDLIVGALGYLHRGLQGNPAKLKIIELIQSKSGYSLLKSTLFKEEKVNLLVWQPIT